MLNAWRNANVKASLSAIFTPRHLVLAHMEPARDTVPDNLGSTKRKQLALRPSTTSSHGRVQREEREYLRESGLSKVIFDVLEVFAAPSSAASASLPASIGRALARVDGASRPHPTSPIGLGVTKVGPQGNVLDRLPNYMLRSVTLQVLAKLHTVPS